jgi:hypothetical protein
MLEDTLGILALYIFSLSGTVVPCVLSEDGKGCSKDEFIAAWVCTEKCVNGSNWAPVFKANGKLVED